MFVIGDGMGTRFWEASQYHPFIILCGVKTSLLHRCYLYRVPTSFDRGQVGNLVEPSGEINGDSTFTRT